MSRSLKVLLIVALAGMGNWMPLPVEEARAQQFPASAVIRGENIRLRAEPAEVTDDLAILQRGDEITITGDVTAADGLAFYPVEVVQTGDAGWVRDLFINPRSIVPLDVPAPEPEPEPAADADAAEGNNERRERPARRDRQNRDAAAADEAAADGAAAAEDVAAEDAAAADAAAQDAAAAEPPAEAVAVAGGAGTARSERFALEPGRYRLTAAMEVSEAGNFVCDIFGPEDFTEPLFNETIDTPQAWTAETNLRIRGDGGDFYVECSEAGGAWTISFVPA